MDNPFSLEGKNIIVTGASSGIGRKCAMDCAAMGARVILIGRNEQRLQETMLQMANDNHVLLSLDLTNIELMAQKVKEVVKEVGFIAGVINCAGVSSVTPLKLIKETDMTAMIQSNIYSALFLTKEICRMGHYGAKGSFTRFVERVEKTVSESTDCGAS